MKSQKGFLILILVLYVSFLLSATPLNGESDQDYLEEHAFFKVKIIAPTSNPDRMQLSLLIAEELETIGIQTELALMSWAAFGPRVTDQEVGVFQDGGYERGFRG